jgi:hypothetical protein
MAKEDTRDLEKFLAAYPEPSREIALWLREFVWALYPDCNELIYDNYNFLAIGWAPNDKAGDTFCTIALGTRGVAFGFTWGSKLADPEKRLRGSGNRFRSLRVPDKESFPAAYVKKLMAEAYANCLEKLKGKEQKLKGATIVKSVSPTQRRPGMAPRAPQTRRGRYPMPDFILEALEKTKLFDAYSARPPYQQNDYVGWITRAKREETRDKRLDQMLDELERGDVYMNMAYKAKN